MRSLYDRKLVLFTGKGGVGKTTVAAAFAKQAAKDGKRTLLIQINAKDRVGAMFGVGKVGDEIREIEENLFAVAATPESAMREYALMTLRVKVLYKAIFENSIIRAFLKAIPGINELVMLGKAYFHAVVEEEKGQPAWDLVVVDAPATGHGIFFLQIPDVITSILTSGPMYDEAQKMLDTIRDPSLTSINIVTLAEDLPVNESKMLFNTATKELGVPVDYVFVNRVLEPLFSDSEMRAILESESTNGFIEAAKFRSSRTYLQRWYAPQIAEIPRPHIELPFVFEPTIGPKSLDRLGQIIAGGACG